MLDDLGQQLVPGVEVVIYRNHGEVLLSHIRQALVEDARGTYLCFVDDDDRLPPYYVSEVLPLLDGVDYIGWRMQAYFHGHPMKPTFHALNPRGWWETDNAFYRDISHLNPVRTELARKCDFRRGEPPEDVSWADQMRPLVRTQNVVPDDRVMYHYYSDSDSSWPPGHEPPWDGTGRLPVEALDDSGPIRWHPDST